MPHLFDFAQKSGPSIEPLYNDLSIHAEKRYSVPYRLISVIQFLVFSSAPPVEMRGLEPLASSVQGRRSPS
jgi:hypothetical protein